MAEVLASNPILTAGMDEIKERACKDQGRPNESNQKTNAPEGAEGTAGQAIALNELLGEKYADLVAEDATALEEWRDYVVQMCDQFITFVVDDSSLRTAEYGERLQATVLPKVEGTVLGIYDVKAAGESSSNANVRLPPLRGSHLKRC